MSDGPAGQTWPETEQNRPPAADYLYSPKHAEVFSLAVARPWSRRLHKR